MNAVDVFVIAVVGGLGLLGFKRGFIREVIESVGAILAGYVALRTSPAVIDLLGIVQTSGWHKPAVVAGVFLVCMIALTILGSLLARLLHAVNLGTYDHLAGFVLGAVKGGIAVAVLGFAALSVGGSLKQSALESRFVRADLAVFDWMLAALPPSFQEKYAGVAKHLGLPGNGGSLAAIPLTIVGASSPDEDGAGIDGYIVAWDPNTRRGTLGFDLGGRRGEAAMFPESIRYDSPQANDLQIGQHLRFDLAYDIQSGQICAVRAVPVGGNP